jgi:hypothetical protein
MLEDQTKFAGETPILIVRLAIDDSLLFRSKPSWRRRFVVERFSVK